MKRGFGLFMRESIGQPSGGAGGAKNASARGGASNIRAMGEAFKAKVQTIDPALHTKITANRGWFRDESIEQWLVERVLYEPL